MPFQFDPSEYKNKFVAKAISSELRPNDNDPTKEVWYAVLLRLKANPTRTDWEPIDSGLPCNIPGCVNIKPWHTHARWYESDRANSPAHRFVTSIGEKGNITPTGPNSILEKVLLWEEEITPERRNPNTGGMYKEQRNYYVAGTAELNPAQPTAATTNGQATNEDLPWDAPSPVVTAPVSAPVSTPVAVAAPMTYEEAAINIAATMMDGKTHEEVRVAIVANPQLRAVPGLLFAFVNGKMVEELKASAMITQDENGVFHAAA